MTDAAVLSPALRAFAAAARCATLFAKVRVPCKLKQHTATKFLLAKKNSYMGCQLFFRGVPPEGEGGTKKIRANFFSTLPLVPRLRWACTSPPISGGRVGNFRSVRKCLSAAEDSRIHCGILSLPRNSSMPLNVKSGTTLLSESFWASNLALNPSSSICCLCSAALSSAWEAS